MERRADNRRCVNPLLWYSSRIFGAPLLVIITRAPRSVAAINGIERSWSAKLNVALEYAVKPFLSGMGSYGGSRITRHHPSSMTLSKSPQNKRQFSQASHLDQRKHLCLWEMWRFVFPIPDIKRTSLIVAPAR
jgi:hypothetical protein